MTIDELARRSGVTSRNIRAYQERGLLPPPAVRGRVGWYGEAHLARLRHIAQLAERGFSLAAIRELFRAWERGHGLAEVLGFEEALAEPWVEEPEQVLSRAELAAFFGDDEPALRRSVEIGVLEELGDERYRVPSPRVLRVGAALVAAGIPLDAVLDEGAALRDAMDRVADRFVRLFLQHVWDPYVARGMPPEELSGVTEALRRLRPLAALGVEPLLAAAMERRVESATAETLGALAPDGQGGHGVHQQLP